MDDFKIVSNKSAIKLNNEWREAVNSSGKDSLVDEKGERITSAHNGRKYRIISNKERTFSMGERIGRGFLGFFAVVCTFGVALVFENVRNLFLKTKENIYFGVLENGRVTAPKTSLNLPKNFNLPLNLLPEDMLKDLDQLQGKNLSRFEESREMILEARKMIAKGSVPPIFKIKGNRQKIPAVDLIADYRGDTKGDLFKYMYENGMGRSKEEMEKQAKIAVKIKNEKYCGDFHGVERDKGGKVTLLNIMLEGAAKMQWAGPFGDNTQPQWFAAPHGPFYIMLDNERIEQQNKENQELIGSYIYDESTMKAIIIPDKASLEFFQNKLDHAVKKDMLTQDEADRMKKKLITYDEFLSLKEGVINNKFEFKKELDNLRAGV